MGYLGQARTLGRRLPVLMPVKAPKTLELCALDMVVSKGHVDGSRQSVPRIEILHGSRKQGDVPRNRDSRQTSSREFIPIKQVPGWAVRHRWPGINPNRISEEWGFDRKNKVRFAPEEVLGVSVKTVRIEVT